MKAAGFKLTFHGVRGGFPSAGLPFAWYGGNTPCISVEAADWLLIFDAGTGIINLGRELYLSKKTPKLALFFTHYHYDHLWGLPFFAPLYFKQNTLHLLGCDCAGGPNLKTVLEEAVRPPYFPLKFSQSAARKIYYGLGQTAAVLMGAKPLLKSKIAADEKAPVVKIFKGRHPLEGVCVYAICFQGRKAVFATDVELALQKESELIDFVSGADVLIQDAQYTTKSYLDRRWPKKGWGHSTVEMACAFAKKAQVKKLVLFHHDPRETDRDLENKKRAARKLFGPTLEIAREGLEISV